MKSMKFANISVLIKNNRGKPTTSLKLICKKSTLCNGLGTFANEDITKGEVILKFYGRIIEQPDHYTIQIGNEMYIERSNQPDDYLNHSCNPNCYIKYNGLFLVALRNIKKGEELCYHYCTTEYDLGEYLFKCNCKSSNCLGTIKGFKYLTNYQKLDLEPYLFYYLKKKMDELLSIQGKQTVTSLNPKIRAL